ncbi:uncharacterized protein LOC125199766 [Salvia hispanica]|uniref:uncharacterized protein LOC125199766 n=1 Tax=Salvia hispanica TaxID=49212 RepID=UPI002009D395|nr:uncharacterized protein LOC125199766 [Salvia hispanica]
MLVFFNLRILNRNEIDPLDAKSIFHSKHKEENNIDPDDGNSKLCGACNVPIFSTPFKATESGSGYLHDQCSNLPIDSDCSDLHPSLEPLEKQPNLEKSNCSHCKAVCGDVLYRCRGPGCGFQLNVTCAWTVKIMHRSHDHRLTVFRCSAADASFACCACGTGHRPGLLWVPSMPLVYVCGPCGFWLHPHCAALPNVIEHQSHKHPLLLNYGIRSSTCQCAICGEEVSSWGVYSCTMCRYYVHIMCAVTERQSFESVLLGEAFGDGRIPGLVHFPVPDEYTSIVRHITKNTPTTSDVKLQHRHPLTLHHDYPIYKEADDEVDRPPTCNACVQFISPPFYSCSWCPKLFLHDSCARLPSVLRQNPIAIPLDLIDLKTIESTTCCNRNTNAFTFRRHSTNMDVMCALMPTSITHAAHAKTHVLRSSASGDLEACRCCGGLLSGVSYKCGTCRNFSIHGTCARLPATVRHVCDPHPLKLVTAPPPRRQPQTNTIYCDACERGLDDARWHYGCAECKQAFHVECVPCLDKLSLVKYEMVEVSERCHECPLTLVRVHMVCGRQCGVCRKGYLGHRDSTAFACFKCYFSIHVSCAFTWKIEAIISRINCL